MPCDHGSERGRLQARADAPRLAARTEAAGAVPGKNKKKLSGGDRKAARCNARRWSAFTRHVFAIVAETGSKPGLHVNCSFIRKQIEQSTTESKISLYC